MRDAELWDDVASSWDESRGSRALRAYSDGVNQALLDRWLPVRIGTVLKTDLFDEAKGEGLVRSLLERADRVVGIDVSAAIVREAAARNPDLEAIVADVQALPFEPRTFDVVVSNSTLDHFPDHGDIDRSLVELARVLRPGGLLLITLDNAANPVIWLRNRLPYALLRRSRLVPYPVGRTLGPGGLRDAVARAGFAVEDTAAIAHVPRVLVRALGLRSRRLLDAEWAGAAPTRALTAQFVAVLARWPGAADARGTARTPAGSGRKLFERALAATVLRRLTLLALDLDRRPASRDAAVPLGHGFLSAADAKLLHERRGEPRAVARARLARGERCFAARASDGRIVSVRWIARGAARIDFLDCTLALAPDEAYNFDTWTDRSVRGLGVAAATGARLNEVLAEEGVRTLLRAVWPANEPGLRNAAREGFVSIGAIASLRLGPFRLRTVRRRR